MLNYFSFNKFKDKYLLTNEQGFHAFLSPENFKMVMDDDIDNLPSDVRNDLKESLFIFDENREVFIERAAGAYREYRQYLFEATSLHIFVLTNICNMRCVYCQAQCTDQKDKGKMPIDVAEKAVDIALQTPKRGLTFEFQGGEPLLNFDVIKHIVEYTEARKNDKDIVYTVVTNTVLLNPEIIEFFKKYKFMVSISLDGDEALHNYDRPLVTGEGSFSYVQKGIEMLHDADLGFGAIQTTTRKSLSCPDNIVDTYVGFGLHNIFVRPLTPLGFAKESWEEIGYSAEEFLEFYKKMLDKIIEVNENGYFLSEGHASVFLKKILKHNSLNYMELRSPCGAGIGQMAYYYDGNIYTCDEGRMMAEMGINEFRLGDVDSTYDELVSSDSCKITCQASLLEGIPACCDCVYHPYCGVCPVVNYAMNKNLYARETNGYKCKIYKGILDIIFEYLYNNEHMDVFERWAN